MGELWDFTILFLIMQISEMDNRRKICALLELAGKTDTEITRVLDNEDKVNEGFARQTNFMSQRVKKYIERAKVKQIIGDCLGIIFQPKSCRLFCIA